MPQLFEIPILMEILNFTYTSYTITDSLVCICDVTDNCTASNRWQMSLQAFVNCLELLIKI